MRLLVLIGALFAALPPASLRAPSTPAAISDRAKSASASGEERLSMSTHSCARARR